MAVNLSIKSVPDDWAERLRQRAERNHRSLQGELMALLERALNDPEPPALVTGPAEALGGTRRGTLSIEEVSRRAAARFSHVPPEVAANSRSVDIVREMRDSRWA